MQATADQFEIENLCFCLPKGFTAEALAAIDYNELFLAASDSLPRLQIKSQALDEIRQNVDLINNRVKSYSDAYQPEQGQIPRPSVLRKMGVISQQINDQMGLFAQQWTSFIEQILSEHKAVLTLTHEYQKSDSEHRELSRRASIRQQEEMLKLKQQLADTQLERDKE